MLSFQGKNHSREWKKKAGQMINMRLFPLLKTRLIFQEPLADHTSGAIWKHENRASWYGRHAEAVQNVYGPQAARKRLHQCAETNIIPDKLLNSLGSPGLSYSASPLGVPQVWGGATNGCGANQTTWTTTAPACIPSQLSSWSLISRLHVIHCFQGHFYNAISVLSLLLFSLGIS